MGRLHEIGQQLTADSVPPGSFDPKEYAVVNLADKYLQKPKTLAEKILKKTAVSASITIPVQKHDSSTGNTDYITTTIPFYMENDFSYGLSNEWSNLLNEDLNKYIFSGAVKVNNMAQSNTQITMQSEIMSTKVYQSSSFEGFSVQCLFICTNRKINPVNIINMLAAGCLPMKLYSTDQSGGVAFSQLKSELGDLTGDLGSWVGDTGTAMATALSKVSTNNPMLAGLAKMGEKAVTWVANSAKAVAPVIQAGIEDLGMLAPLQYAFKLEDDGINGRVLKPRKGTTLSLQIGNYFRADSLLLRSINNITFSKEVIAPATGQILKRKNDIYNPAPAPATMNNWGFPLYAKCTLQLIPSSMLHYDKYYSYFIPQRDDLTMNDVRSSVFNLPN